MPHVVLRGKVSVCEWSRNFAPLVEENQYWRIKIDEVYVERKGVCALLPAVVVEEDHPQSFYLQLSFAPEKGLTIRLDSSTDPIKTRGVKRSIALVAESFLHMYSDVEIERHNLQGFISLYSNRPASSGGS